MAEKIKRGEVYFTDLGHGSGSEQAGRRPVIVLQNDIGNRFSTTVIVAALTSKVNVKARIPTHCYLKDGIGLSFPSIVLLEQLRTVDKCRLEEYVGKLSKEQMEAVDRALAISLGLLNQINKE